MIDCLIKTENLTKIYDNVKAVDSINIEIAKQDICGFLGPNGAGKTTTIGMLTGLIEPTNGRCFVDGIDVAKQPLVVKSIIGYLPESVGFYSNLTGKQNLKYLSSFYNLDKAEVSKRIETLLEYVGLGNVDKTVGSYSKGMKQRLGLARALVNDPKVLFLDEPTSGLDPEGVMQFRKIVREQSEEGKTIFFSSHVLNEVQNVCSTICIISKGNIVAQGKVDDIKLKLSRGKHINIFVKIAGPVPEFYHPEIVDVQQDNGWIRITAKSDISDDISTFLFDKNIRIKELKLAEESLETIFMDSIYRGE